MNNSYNIHIEQGTSLNISLTASDSSGNPLNLSGYSVSGQAKYSYGSTGILLNLNPTVDPSLISGIINISVPPEASTGIPITKGVYEILAYGTGDYCFKVIGGYIDVYPGLY